MQSPATRTGPAPESQPAGGLTRAEAIERLGGVQQEWLHTPDRRLWGVTTPAYVIQRERLRLPLGIDGEEAKIDCDCPLCQMMADSGPFFWDLGTHDLDQEFPFALFFATREAWEDEQRFRGNGMPSGSVSNRRGPPSARMTTWLGSTNRSSKNHRPCGNAASANAATAIRGKSPCSASAPTWRS